MSDRIHSIWLALRRPYKIVLCCAANVLVILFAVIEGVQMTQTRAAMNAAIESRYYTGTLSFAAEDADGSAAVYNGASGLIGEDAAAILGSSPYVETVQFCVRKTARFGGKKRCAAGDAAQYCMFVGVASGEVMSIGERLTESQRFYIRPTYIAAGDPDTFDLGYGEGHINPGVRIYPPDETFETHQGERYFLLAQTPHRTKQSANMAYLSSTAADPETYRPGQTLLVREEPGDETLSDAEFAAKVMAAYGLEAYAERLNDLQDMTPVTEIPTLDMLLPWRNGTMRIVVGRAITEADAGQKVCMVSVDMLLSLRMKVGDTLVLRLSGSDLSGGAPGGIPTMETEYDPDDFGPMEEYLIVGSYKNEGSGGYGSYYGRPQDLFLNDILIPRAADLPYEPVGTARFSFSVHKDSYEAFAAETEPLLEEAGYSVVMVRPEYAEIEEQIEGLRSDAVSTFVKAGLALAAGILIATGALVLFWRGDYLAERRLGAWRREAAGLYVRAYGVTAFVSVLLSALAVRTIAGTGLIPFLSAETLTPSVWGGMAAFAAAELLVYGALASAAVLAMDHRRFGAMKAAQSARLLPQAEERLKNSRKGLDLLPVFRRWRSWAVFAAAVLLLLLSAAWMDKTVADTRDEIDRSIREMDVRFVLGPGRRSASNGFTVTMRAIRAIEHMEYFEDFGCDELSLRVRVENPDEDPEQPDRPGLITEDNSLTVCWTSDPGETGVHAVEGDLGEGIWLPESVAERHGVRVGDVFRIYRFSAGKAGKVPLEVPVAAVTDADRAYMSEEYFDEMYDWWNMSFGQPEFYLTDLHFSLKKEYNTQLADVEKKVQSLVNTPHPQDRNRDVSVNYNAAEIDGMLEPLEKTVASAEYFGRLFRTVLPAAAYLIALIAMMGFRNEIGAARFLGEDRRSVFSRIWIPAAALCLPGYILAAAVMLLTPLRAYAPWRMTLWHLAGAAALTALTAGLLCSVRPLDLLKEKEDE